MPVTIKKSQLLYKDTSTGNYVSVDAVADKTSEQQINGIQVAANNAISAINDALDDISTEPLTELPKKAYKNDLTTNAESLGSSASKAYSVGDYFYVSDNENDRSLYKVTADIASGDTISAGTAASNNCIPAALAEDVNALSNDIINIRDDLNTYFVRNTNLFNHNDPNLIENVEIKSNGTTSEKTGYFASGYIPAIPGSTICCHYPTSIYGAASIAVLYNENKESVGYYASNYIERLADINNHGYIRISIPADANFAFFRFTGQMSGYQYYMYIYADVMPSEYQSYGTTVELSDEVKIQYGSISNVSVSVEDIDFIKPQSVNLVDLSKMTVGIITNSTNNGNIDETVTNKVTTDYIPVEAGKTYSLSVYPGVYYGAGYRGTPYYNADKQFLGRIVQEGGSSATVSQTSITIPDDERIKYIRTSYASSYATNPKQWWYTMIVEGEWPGDLYIPYDNAKRLVNTDLGFNQAVYYNRLFGKSIIWNGDSICAADNDSKGGWPGRIGETNGMSFKNYGVSGGTIAITNVSGLHSVVSSVPSMIAEHPNADYIIIEGGTNDADRLGDSGIGNFDPNDFSSEYITALDNETFSGALETIFYTLVTERKGKHIGYLIPQKMGHTEVLVTRRRTYFDRAINICKKWGIPYLDLWNGLYLNWRLSAHWNQELTSAENEAQGYLYYDGQHLTTTGYAIESPIIEEWLKTF